MDGRTGSSLFSAAILSHCCQITVIFYHNYFSTVSVPCVYLPWWCHFGGMCVNSRLHFLLRTRKCNRRRLIWGVLQFTGLPKPCWSGVERFRRAYRGLMSLRKWHGSRSTRLVEQKEFLSLCSSTKYSENVTVLFFYSDSQEDFLNISATSEFVSPKSQ